MKKIRSVGLSLLLVLSVGLSACAKNDNSGGNAAKDSEPGTNFSAKGYPIMKDPVTVSMMSAQNPLVGDYENLQFFKVMKEKTNINFKFSTVPSSDYDQKKNLAFASGEIPDVFFGGMLTADDEVKYGGQGVLIPLEGLIEKYAPHIQQMFDEQPDIKKSITTPDGHIYALPGVNSSSIAKIPPMWVNNKWLEALGVKTLPKTTDELYELLKRFKDEDPNKNGKADEIPITSMNLGDIRQPLLAAFGLLSRDKQISDGKVIFGAIQPEFKDYLTYMHKLWTDDLLDHGTFTQTTEQKVAKGHNNQVGMVVDALSYLTFGGDGLKDPILPVLTSPTHPDNPIYPEGTGMSRGTFAITEQCKYPEAMIRWVDYLYSQEGETLLHYGQEGSLWEWADEAKGLRRYINHDGMNVEEYRGGKITPAVGTPAPMWTKAEVEASWDDPTQQVRIKQTDTVLAPYAKVVFPDIYLTSEEQSEINGIQTDLNTYLESMEAKFITGEMPLNKWDSFVSTIKNMGVDRLIKTYQTAYDRWDSAK